MADLMTLRRRIIASQPHLMTAASGNTSDSTVVAHFKTRGEYPMKSLQVNFPIKQSGSGDPSPSNIRAINGYDDITLTRAGVNFLQCYTFTNTNYGGFTCTGVRNADGEIEYIDMVGTKTVQNVFRNLNYESGKKNFPPIGSYAIGTYSDQANIMFGGSDWSPADRDGYSYSDNEAKWKIYDIIPSWFTRNTRHGACRIQIPPWNTETREINTRIYPMVCLLQDYGCDYEPYRGKKYTASLPSTVYCGTIDFINGTMISEWACDTITWGENYNQTKDLGNHTIRGFNLAYRTVADGIVHSICDQAPYLYKYSSDTVHQYTAKGSAADYAYIALPNGTSNDTIIQFCYKLQTPITYSITPQRIATLSGVNNIWSDDGQVTVEYWTH